MTNNGGLIDTIQKFLDEENAHYKTYPIPLVEGQIVRPTAIAIGTKKRELVISETGCKAEQYFNQRDSVDVHASITEIAPSEDTEIVKFTKDKGSKNLNIETKTISTKGFFGPVIRVGDTKLAIRFKDVLKEPARNTESLIINCRCDNKGLICKGTKI